MRLEDKRVIDCTIPEVLCKVFGHKISRLELIMFQIKNTPVNISRHGYYKLKCPRCGEVFDPTPDPVVVDGSHRPYTAHISPETLPEPPLPRWMVKSPPSVPTPTGPIPPVDDD